MIVERIKEYLDKKGISIAAFERSIGMSNASFGKSLKNKGAIGTDKLENILTIYKDISPSWLLTGEGNMLKSSPSATPDTPQQSSPEAPSQEKEPRGKRGKVAQDTTDPSVAELARIITEQAKELARQSKEITDQAREIAQRDVEIIQLKEQVRQLTIEKARDADDAPSQAIAHAG